MRTAIYRWLVLVLLPCSFAVAHGENLSQWRVLEPGRATWKAAESSAAVEGSGPGWNALLSPAVAPANCRLECQFTIERPARPGWSTEHTAFCGYRVGREDSGYDVGTILRYIDREHFYRVQFSSRGQELAIWKPRGGFVCVVPAALAERKPHRLAVEARGPWIEVFLDGKSAARWFDALEPILSGKAGLACDDSKLRFEQVKLTALDAQTPAAPATQSPEFHVRKWRDREWIFDRQEPIALLDRQTLVLWEVKLRSGFRPMLYWELFWKQYDGVHNYSDKLDELEVVKQHGPELQLAWKSQNPAKQITTSATMSLTLDKDLNSYAYDVTTQFTVNPGQTWKDMADGLEYCNLIPYNVVGPATTGQSNDWPWWYQWVVYSNPDGSPAKHPLSHNRLQYLSPKPDGGYYGYLGKNPLNPIVFFHNPTDASLKGYAGLCHWAHDIHFRYRPYTSGHVMPAGTRHEARYRVVGFDAARSAKLLASSAMHPFFVEKEQYPIYVSGVNTFQASQSRSEPQREYEWRGGDWDQMIGHGDQRSMRLTGGQPGKDRSVVDLGGSAFSEPIRPGLYTITAWVKTKDVQGDGATIGVQLIYPDDKPIYCPRRIQGTSEWQQLKLTANLPQRAAVRVILEAGAKGTAWFDDLEVTYPR